MRLIVKNVPMNINYIKINVLKIAQSQHLNLIINVNYVLKIVNYVKMNPFVKNVKKIIFFTKINVFNHVQNNFIRIMNNV